MFVLPSCVARYKQALSLGKTDLLVLRHRLNQGKAQHEMVRPLSLGSNGGKLKEGWLGVRIALGNFNPKLGRYSIKK